LPPPPPPPPPSSGGAAGKEAAEATATDSIEATVTARSRTRGAAMDKDEAGIIVFVCQSLSLGWAGWAELLADKIS
jgi:hypothetical protein